MTYHLSSIVHIDCQKCGRSYSFHSQTPVDENGCFGYVDTRCPECQTTPDFDQLVNAKIDMVEPHEKVALDILGRYPTAACNYFTQRT